MVNKKIEPISSIFVPNNVFNLTNWVPSLNENCVDINSHSWFDINICNNPSINYFQKYDIQTSNIPLDSYMQQMKSIRRRKLDKFPQFIFTNKIRLFPNFIQKNILKEWFYATTKMFNLTVQYIRQGIYINGKLIEIDSITDYLNKTDFRFNLKGDRDKIISSMKYPKTISHVLDEAIQQVVSNYKTCLTNFKNGYIKKFRIRQQSYDRRRYIIKIESQLFKNGSFCVSTFPSIKSSEPLTNINSTTTLLYDRDTQKYILLVPSSMDKEERTVNVLDCGIDLGVRTFATVYSEANIVNIGNNLYEKIKKYHNKIDKINELLSLPLDQKEVFLTRNIIVKKKVKMKGGTKIIKKKKQLVLPKKINRSRLKKGLRKYHRKIKNMVKDLHFKSANYLVKNYDSIYIGKFSTKQILSRRNIKITKKTKRMVGVLSPYLFRQRLNYMGRKYGSFVGEVSEYLSTKTCCNCGKLNEIGASKEHKCSCGMKTDRDACSAKNHLKLGYMNYITNENDLKVYQMPSKNMHVIYDKRLNNYEVFRV